MGDAHVPEGPMSRLRRGLSHLRPHALPPRSPEELLEHAANCYMRGQWLEDAARVYEQLGNLPLAASCMEHLGRWHQAARLHARSENWPAAARSFLSANLPAEAAEALIHAGDHTHAAWLLAHAVQHFGRAKAIADRLPADNPVDRVEIQLVLARCEAGATAARAARRLHEAIQWLPTSPPDSRRQRIFEWSKSVAECLRRPDLIATLHAAAFSAGLYGSEQAWQEWSLEALGSSAGIPQRERTVTSLTQEAEHGA